MTEHRHRTCVHCSFPDYKRRKLKVLVLETVFYPGKKKKKKTPRPDRKINGPNIPNHAAKVVVSIVQQLQEVVPGRLARNLKGKVACWKVF
jgi:hypothetical protein